MCIRDRAYNVWLQGVIDHCLKLNEGMTESMEYNEIKGIAKSISRYCWKKDAYCYQEFIDRQSRKGRLGGIKSNSSNGGYARSQKYDEKRILALKLKEQGASSTEISKQIGVTTRTLRNWFN